MASLPISFTPELQRLLTPADRAQFLSDFKEWKGVPNNGKQTSIFGKDGLNKDSKYLRHAHMVPVAPQSSPPPPPPIVGAPLPQNDLKQWEAAYNYNQKHNSNQHQTSNRYLFYAYDKRYGFLLISMVNAGAHDIWEPKYRAVLQEWEEIAENFVCLGAVPAD